MKCLVLLLASATLWAQVSGPLLSAKDEGELATRMLQLMESTAVAVPGLTSASQPVRQNAQATAAAMARTPQNPAPTYQFINQVKAYLALSDSFARPADFPAAGDRQYAELRDDLARILRHFEAQLVTVQQTDQKRDADPNGLKRYADADSKVLPATKAPRVVFLGDSITGAWRLNEYFTGRDFINRGIGGQTTLQMIARFRQDVAALNPKAVIVLAGTNDIAAGIDARQIEENLATIGDLAKAHGIKVALASILPVSDYHKDADPHFEMTPTRPPATIQAINSWLRGYCQMEGFVYVDYYSVLVDAAGRMQSELSDDGLHPNAKGYRVMSPVALEAIGRALSGSDAPRRRFGLSGQ